MLDWQAQSRVMWSLRRADSRLCYKHGEAGGLLMKSHETALADQRNSLQGYRGHPQQRGTSWWGWLNFLLGPFVSGVLLFLVLRNIEIAQVQRELQSISILPLMLAACVGASSDLVRAVRWGVLLGYAPPAGWRVFYTSIMIGCLANNVLPARMGELVRIYILERQVGVSKSTSAATIVLERLTDVLLLLAMIDCIAFFIPLPVVLHGGVWIATAVFGAMALGLLCLALKGDHLVRLSTHIAGLLSQSVGTSIQGILERFIDGLSLLRSSRQVLYVLLLTLMIWGIEVVSVGLTMQSFNLNLPWIAPLLVSVMLSLSFVIPAAPGAVGTYEFFVIVALTPFAVESNQAMGLAFVLHAMMYIMTTALGLICLWVVGLPLRRLITKARNQQEEKV